MGEKLSRIERHLRVEKPRCVEKFLRVSICTSWCLCAIDLREASPALACCCSVSPVLVHCCPCMLRPWCLCAAALRALLDLRNVMVPLRRVPARFSRLAQQSRECGASCRDASARSSRLARTWALFAPLLWHLFLILCTLRRGNAVPLAGSSRLAHGWEGDCGAPRRCSFAQDEKNGRAVGGYLGKRCDHRVLVEKNAQRSGLCAFYSSCVAMQAVRGFSEGPPARSSRPARANSLACPAPVRAEQRPACAELPALALPSAPAERRPLAKRRPIRAALPAPSSGSRPPAWVLHTLPVQWTC